MRGKLLMATSSLRATRSRSNSPGERISSCSCNAGAASTSRAMLVEIGDAGSEMMLSTMPMESVPPRLERKPATLRLNWSSDPVSRWHSSKIIRPLSVS